MGRLFDSPAGLLLIIAVFPAHADRPGRMGTCPIGPTAPANVEHTSHHGPPGGLVHP
jgi:hypothetical protein